eukprot:gnl/TRDRNA2_/TRDRNA2_142822_c0_seq1.p1 gnl/TRDRNA2_/TRDRNA2_142822_c0~~gnl/TRDRNA2_/TRDRNA2_142822_c0_seq1.p1  ORF type:complete len:486 (+),score=54.80 gnl/TRDRNA2_/TRDRNA2_142822_c0_seq1:109-1566(+)
MEPAAIDEESEQRPVDLKCCGIWSLRDSYSTDLKWILQGQIVYFIITFVECMVCAFGLGLIHGGICHSLWVLQFILYWVQWDCLKGTKKECGRPGKGSCASSYFFVMHILFFTYAACYIVGSAVMLGVIGGYPEKYMSPSTWEPTDVGRRLQALRPILISSLSHREQAECDLCMSQRACCLKWGKCAHDVLESEASMCLSDSLNAAGDSDEGCIYRKNCGIDPYYCWSVQRMGGKLGAGRLKSTPPHSFDFQGGPCFQASQAAKHFDWALYLSAWSVFNAMFLCRLGIAARRLWLATRRGETLSLHKSLLNPDKEEKLKKHRTRTGALLQQFLSNNGEDPLRRDGKLDGPSLKALQSFLKKRGFYHMSIDGKFGHHSICALQMWLRDEGFEHDDGDDGTWGEDTWKNLVHFLENSLRPRQADPENATQLEERLGLLEREVAEVKITLRTLGIQASSSSGAYPASMQESVANACVIGKSFPLETKA